MGHRTARRVYWVATLLFIVPQVWSAFQMLIQAPRMAATLHHLGYPSYFMVSLGVVKLLGAAVILLGLWPDLKEWAYAGYTFDTVGAFVSHVGAGDSLGTAAVPLIFLAVQLVSYVSWRRLGKPQLMAAAPASQSRAPHDTRPGPAVEAR